MDVQQILKVILKDIYQTLKTSNRWSSSYQRKLRDLSSLEMVSLAEVLSCDCKHSHTQRIIMTIGQCGIGKSTMVQRCALDWAEGKGYSNIGLLFPMTFWELSLVKHKLTFLELLQMFYPELQTLGGATLNREDVWFVLDGLETFEVPRRCPVVTDVCAVSTVGVLLANLFKGNLLPNAHIWMTSQIVACLTIPQAFILKQTEIPALEPEEKEQLFKNVIVNDDLVFKAINHIKISKTLNSICGIPLICASAASVLKDHVKKSSRFEINPINLTQIYTQLIKALTPSTIASLKHLALNYGKKLKIFCAQFLADFGISEAEALAISREWPLLIREMTGVGSASTFCFGHSSMQAFLAAWANLDKMQSLAKDLSSSCCDLVDLATFRDAGPAWDYFILFFFGHLKVQNLLPPTDPFFNHTKNMILGNVFSNVGARLCNCLKEYDSQALLPEVQLFMKTGISLLPGFSVLDWNYLEQMRKSFEGIKFQFYIKVSDNFDETLSRSFVDILKSEEAV